MEKEVVIDLSKTYTKTEYAKAYNISRPTIDKLIEDKTLKVIEVKGTTLILAR